MTLYHFVSTLGALGAVPLFTLYSLFTGRKRRGLIHHFGWVPCKPPAPGQKTLWTFALSLGEATAAAAVLKIVHEARPDVRIVVSATTDSGYDGARRKIPFAEEIFFHPFDCLPFTVTALNRIRPDVFLVADTGFWPGLLDLLAQRKIPSLLFNGRISKRSFKGYRSARQFSKNLFNRFSVLCMQSQDGKDSMQSLGVDPSKLRMIGDPKFDALVPVSDNEREKTRLSLGIRPTSPVWVAGSTHAGEEEIILQAFQNLQSRFDDLVLILAPRRLERVREVESLLKTRQIPFIKRTAINESSDAENRVILLDAMGELAKLYSIGEAAFVGRSLIPPGGGHNLMEPAAHGGVVIHGPHIENFRRVAEELKQQGLAFPVNNADEMKTVLESLLRDTSKQTGRADKASEWIKTRQGASRRMADIILETLKN